MIDLVTKEEDELEAALCEFCNNAEDEIANVHLWSESVRRDFKRLTAAYNKWYSAQVKPLRTIPPVDQFNDRKTLVDRLMGKYVIPVNDGAGLLNGKDTFTRNFSTSPINREAANEILQLIKLVRDSSFAMVLASEALKGTLAGKRIEIQLQEALTTLRELNLVSEETEASVRERTRSFLKEGK